MEPTLIDVFEQEAKDLELHVDLCHRRYLQLIGKIEHVDSKLEDVMSTLKEIKEKLDENESKIIDNQIANYQKFLGWAAMIIVGAGSWLGHFLLK